LGDTRIDSTLVTEHCVFIGGLQPSTTYYFEVQSTDESLNTTTDDNGGAYYDFTTGAAPEPLVSVTDAIVSLLLGFLSLIDKVLGGLVDLGATNQLTGMGQQNVRWIAEIVVAIVDRIAWLLEQLVIIVKV
jgi:hypothetical protein